MINTLRLFTFNYPSSLAVSWLGIRIHIRYGFTLIKQLSTLALGSLGSDLAGGTLRRHWLGHQIAILYNLSLSLSLSRYPSLCQALNFWTMVELPPKNKQQHFCLSNSANQEASWGQDNSNVYVRPGSDHGHAHRVKSVSL